MKIEEGIDNLSSRGLYFRAVVWLLYIGISVRYKLLTVIAGSVGNTMKQNRRSVVKKTGAVLSAISLATTPVLGASSSDGIISDRTYDQMREEYGEDEAKVIRRILTEYIQKYRAGALSQDQAYEKATNKLINHSKTNKIPKSINNVEAFKKNHHEAARRGSDAPINNSSAATTSASESIDVSEGEKGGDSSFITGSADRSYDVGHEEMGVFTRVSTYGAATSWARLYDSIYVSGDLGGNVRISVPYTRVGNTRNGKCKVSIFIREKYNNNTMVVEPVEWPGWENGSVTKNAQFYLSNGTTYEIGLEVRGSVNGIDAYKFVDYGTAQSDFTSRRVELNGSITIVSLD